MDAKQVLARNFGIWLKRKMDARDWSGADLARAIGRAGGRARPSDVSRWIRGERRPRPDTLEFIADALGVSHAEAMEAAGHTPKVPKDQIEKLHRLVDPYAKHLDWDDPEVQMALKAALDHQVRITEVRSGKRSYQRFSDPVVLDDEDSSRKK